MAIFCFLMYVPGIFESYTTEQHKEDIVKILLEEDDASHYAITVE